jgi:hypothetical protein
MIEGEGFSREAQRYLDGDRVEGLEAGERGAADRLVAEARAYRARLEPIGPALDEAVMVVVRRRVPARSGPGWMAWLLEPRSVRIRPVWVAALAAAAALVLWLAPRRAAPPAAAPAAAPAAPVIPAAVPLAAAATPDTVFVHFELAAPQARTVAVAGSFNGWKVGALEMSRGSDGIWSVTVPLPVGEHHYEFVVDGTRWVPDPTAHVQVDDGFGGRNSVIVVGPKGLVRS